MTKIHHDDLHNSDKQAGAELGKAQLKLGPGRIKALAKSRKVVWD